MNRIKLKKDKERVIRHEQWIEIKQVEGKTVVLRYPPNEEFEKLRSEMDPQPDLIYRRFNFVNGVPREFLWTGVPPQFQLYGGLFLQRITLDEWPVLLEKERNSGTDLVIPAVNPQGRPEALGPCPCEWCTEERDKGLPSRYSRNIHKPT
jgi:hypothetical protein